MPGNTPQLKDILHLLSIPNIGPGRVRRLLSIFETVDEILRAPVQRLMQVNGIDRVLAAQIKSGGDAKVVESQLELLQRQEIQYLTIWDSCYPTLLKQTADPPVILFYKGMIPEKWPVCLAVVGTRTPTAYGKTVAEKLVTGLIQNGIAIVSGFARGIDTIAHLAALKHGGQTFAVLGCGVDIIYPPENRNLYKNIQGGGALLSEFFLGTGPDAINFPRRNRIISGMCAGVLVVEAGQKSGALITARYAADQNREVFAVPGNITNPKTQGTHRLIQQGAKLVFRIDDIFEEISSIRPSSRPVDKPLPPHLNDLERKILTHLSTDPKHIDRLVLELKESPALILSSLLNLELLGLIRQLSGKMFIRT